MTRKGTKSDRSKSLGGTATEISQRRAEIEKWLSEATPVSVAIARSVEKHKVSESTAKRDVEVIRSNWLAAIEREEPERRTKLLGILERIIQEAIEDRAWSAAASAARVIARVMGLDRMTVKLEDAAFDVRTMTPQQREAEIRELLRLESEDQRKAAPGGN